MSLDLVKLMNRGFHMPKINVRVLLAALKLKRTSRQMWISFSETEHQTDY